MQPLLQQRGSVAAGCVQRPGREAATSSLTGWEVSLVLAGRQAQEASLRSGGESRPLHSHTALLVSSGAACDSLTASGVLLSPKGMAARSENLSAFP